MDWFPAKKLKEQNSRHFDQELSALQDVCRDHSDVEHFVRVLMGGLLSGKGEAFGVAEILSDFLYEIYSIDIRTSLINPYHYQGNWVYNLNSFVSNYFLDDSCFMVATSGAFGCWEAMSDQNGTQNPHVLIEAARDNYRFYQECNKLSGLEYVKFLKKGFKTSGKVEELLKGQRVIVK